MPSEKAVAAVEAVCERMPEGARLTAADLAAETGISVEEARLGMKEIACGDGHYRRNSETTGAGGEITVEHAKIYWSDPDVPLATVKRDEAEKATEKIAANVSIRPNLDDTDSESVSVDIFPKAILSDVSFQVGSGELCAVVGRVGSGKSSLCSAVLNEMATNKFRTY